MSLQINFEICPDCCNNQIEFTEETGIYSINNLQGWNSPNVDISLATSAILDIYQPGSTTITKTLNIFGLTGPSTPYPSSDDETGYRITAFAIGLTSITDGIWQFTYTIVADSITYVTTK